MAAWNSWLLDVDVDVDQDGAVDVEVDTCGRLVRD